MQFGSDACQRGASRGPVHQGSEGRSTEFPRHGEAGRASLRTSPGGSAGDARSSGKNSQTSGRNQPAAPAVRNSSSVASHVSRATPRSCSAVVRPRCGICFGGSEVPRGSSDDGLDGPPKELGVRRRGGPDAGVPTRCGLGRKVCLDSDHSRICDAGLSNGRCREQSGSRRSKAVPDRKCAPQTGSRQRK